MKDASGGRVPNGFVGQQHHVGEGGDLVAATLLVTLLHAFFFFCFVEAEIAPTQEQKKSSPHRLGAPIVTRAFAAQFLQGLSDHRPQSFRGLVLKWMVLEMAVSGCNRLFLFVLRGRFLAGCGEFDSLGARAPVSDRNVRTYALSNTKLSSRLL